MMKENNNIKLDMSLIEQAQKFIKEVTEKYNIGFNEKGELIDLKTNKVLVNDKIIKEHMEKENKDGKQE